MADELHEVDLGGESEEKRSNSGRKLDNTPGTKVFVRNQPVVQQQPVDWWGQMTGVQRAFMQFGFAGIVGMLFIGVSFGAAYMLWTLISTQQHQVMDGQQLLRDTLTSSQKNNDLIATRLEVVGSKLEALAVEIRASRQSIERSEKSIKAATPASENQGGEGMCDTSKKPADGPSR